MQKLLVVVDQVNGKNVTKDNLIFPEFRPLILVPVGSTPFSLGFSVSSGLGDGQRGTP
jgi:hypothetical protein